MCNPAERVCQNDHVWDLNDLRLTTVPCHARTLVKAGLGNETAQRCLTGSGRVAANSLMMRATASPAAPAS